MNYGLLRLERAATVICEGCCIVSPFCLSHHHYFIAQFSDLAEFVSYSASSLKESPEMFCGPQSIGLTGQLCLEVINHNCLVCVSKTK